MKILLIMNKNLTSNLIHLRGYVLLDKIRRSNFKIKLMHVKGKKKKYLFENNPNKMVYISKNH